MVKTYVETGCRPSWFVKIMFIRAVLETGVYQPKRSREAPALGKGTWLGPPWGHGNPNLTSHNPGAQQTPEKMQNPAF